jgi:hypothetical protein
MTELQVRIVEAIEAGRLDEVGRLQALYRREGVCASAARTGIAMPMRLVESAPPRTRPTHGTGQRPHWFLGTTTATTTGNMVTVSVAAREAISEACFEARAALWESVECGGFVYGSPDSIVAASVAGPRSERGHGYVELHYGDAREHEERLCAKLAGCWHAHPSPGEPEPSTEDVASWGKAAELIGREYVALIVHDPHQLWVAPELRAWRVHQRDGRLVVEPVYVNQEGA